MSCLLGPNSGQSQSYYRDGRGLRQVAMASSYLAHACLVFSVAYLISVSRRNTASLTYGLPELRLWQPENAKGSVCTYLCKCDSQYSQKATPGYEGTERSFGGKAMANDILQLAIVDRHRHLLGYHWK